MTSVEPPGKVPRELGHFVREILCPQMVTGHLKIEKERSVQSLTTFERNTKHLSDPQYAPSVLCRVSLVVLHVVIRKLRKGRPIESSFWHRPQHDVTFI